MSGINPFNVARATGMATGMDTDMLVKAMSQNQQNKVDMLFKQKTLLEWRRDAINGINDLMSSFKNDFTSLLGANSMMKSDTYRTMSIKNTNEAAATIRAGVNAKAGSYTLQVDELATGARYEGARFSENTPVSITNQTLGSLFGRSDLEAEGEIETTTITDARGVPYEGYSIEINGVEFNFKMTDRLSDVMNTINNNKAANAQLTYSQITNSFTLSSKTMGVDSELEVDEFGSDFFRALGLDIENPSAANGLQDGSNAVFWLNGVRLEESSNNFTFDGIEFTLHAKADSFSFNTERDASKSMDMIKNFVETLNGLAKTLNAHFTTRQNRSFFPLTDWAKEDMSESEIEKWEGRAKEGVLYRDTNVGRVISALQSLVTAQTGSGSLRDIGITGGKYTKGEPFKLEIDEGKLMKALEEDPDKVFAIFTETADRNSSSPSGGIIARINSAFDTYSAFTKSHTLQTLRDNIDKFGKNINGQTDKLYIQQEKLYLKFAAFETAMTKMSAQQNTIFNYFG